MSSVGVDAADAPPNCGRRLIPSAIDHIAGVNPSKVFGSLPISNTNLEEGFKDLTFGQIANAISGVAWWLEKEIGRSDRFETLAYLAPNDFRYPIFAVAAVKARYKVSFHMSLPWQCNCRQDISRRCSIHHGIVYKDMSTCSSPPVAPRW